MNIYTTIVSCYVFCFHASWLFIPCKNFLAYLGMNIYSIFHSGVCWKMFDIFIFEAFLNKIAKIFNSMSTKFWWIRFLTQGSLSKRISKLCAQVESKLDIDNSSWISTNDSAWYLTRNITRFQSYFWITISCRVIILSILQHWLFKIY